MQLFYKANFLAPPPRISYYTDTAASPQITAVLAANPASAPVPVVAPSTNATISNDTILSIPAAGRAEWTWNPENPPVSFSSVLLFPPKTVFPFFNKWVYDSFVHKVVLLVEVVGWAGWRV